MDQETSMVDTDGLRKILTPRQPFGPGNTEAMAHFGPELADQLFDRTNVIYTQAVADAHPTYIIGRKGSGKTAFLVGSLYGRTSNYEILRTETIYHEMLKVLHVYRRDHAQLFVDQAADIWMALFEQVAVFHTWRTATQSDPHSDLQTLTDYISRDGNGPANSTHAAEQFLRELTRHITEDSGLGLGELIARVTNNGIQFERAKKAMRTVLEHRDQPVIIVMDNLEDLHLRLHELTEVLSGLFRCAGRVVAQNLDNKPYGLQICLPSELYDKIHEIVAAPEKDLQGRYLKIYWTAHELLRLTGARLGLFLRTHHPMQWETLQIQAKRVDESDPAIALLRAALPRRIHSGLQIEEDPLGYLLRHTQLLPRHLIEILNSVFSRPDRGSTPWAVTPHAVIAGTRYAERLLVSGILNAYQASYPAATAALHRLTGKLDICFPVNTLHKVYNQQGIKKLTHLDFDGFLSMLFGLGVLGVRFSQTGRYNKAHFQYTFDHALTCQEDSDYLCFHPLFTRYLLERSIPRLRQERARATYPYGCDPKDEDYRQAFGYIEI